MKTKYEIPYYYALKLEMEGANVRRLHFYPKRFGYIGLPQC